MGWSRITSLVSLESHLLSEGGFGSLIDRRAKAISWAPKLEAWVTTRSASASTDPKAVCQDDPSSCRGLWSLHAVHETVVSSFKTLLDLI